MTCENCTEIYCPHRDEMARCYYESFAIPNNIKKIILQEKIKEITKDEESATKFLQSAGIMTEDGELHPRYK